MAGDFTATSEVVARMDATPARASRVGCAPFEAVAGMDATLARAARTAGALRTGLGAGLEALAQTSGHHELGFSSVEAYALERCERSTRWVQESRWLARRLNELPRLRRALAAGTISFSMAQVIARVACKEDEAAFIAEAKRRTVREMCRLVRERREGATALAAGDDERRPMSAARAGCDDERRTFVADANEDAASAGVDDERQTLVITADREDGWLFECARMIVRHVAGLTLEETVEALLGEGTTSLLSTVQRDRIAPFDDTPQDVAQREWEAQRARWREEAEARCEARMGARGTRALANEEDHAAAGAATRDEGRASAGATELAFDGDAEAIDAELRRTAASLATRDVEIGKIAEALWLADGWRRLGYATQAQYARERLGMSLSSLKAKRALARRAARMPRLAAAIANHEIGYEAARLVASVATPDTVEAWVARARERTVRHLREEVDAVTMLRRLAPESSAEPPSETLMRELGSVESRIVSGAAFRDDANGAAFRDEATCDASRAAFRDEATCDASGEDQTSSTKREGQTSSTKREGQTSSTNREGQTSSTNREDQTSATNRDGQTSAAYREGQTSATNRDGQTSAANREGANGEGQTSARLAELLAGFERASGRSGVTRHSGRVTLRLGVSAGTRRYYRWLERHFQRHRPERIEQAHADRGAPGRS